MPLGITGLALNIIPAIIMGLTGILKISMGFPIQHIVAATNMLCILAALLISVTLVRKKETRTIPVIISTVLSAVYIVGGIMMVAALILNSLQN